MVRSRGSNCSTAFFKQGKPIKAICRELGVSRKVVRKAIRCRSTEFRHEREDQPLPKIGRWREMLDQRLLENEGKPSRERLALMRLFEELRGRGYEGGYDAVRRYARRCTAGDVGCHSGAVRPDFGEQRGDNLVGARHRPMRPNSVFAGQPLRLVGRNLSHAQHSWNLVALRRKRIRVIAVTSRRRGRPYLGRHQKEVAVRERGLRAHSDSEEAGSMSMNIGLMNSFAAISQHKNAGILATALVAAGAFSGWGLSATFVKSAKAVDSMRQEVESAKSSIDQAKAALVGSYTVTGTDPDGVPYNGTKIVAISLAPSGALEFDWDDGTFVGVGQIADNVLAVAYAIKGRTVIALMTINPDGSLSGNWLRRTDRGSKGTENWKKKT